MIITIPNGGELYHSSALASIKVKFNLVMKQQYDHYEKGKRHKHNTWISTPGEFLTRKQCSLQASVTPESSSHD